VRRRSAFAFYRSLNRASGRADEPSAAAASVACGGCQWTFKDAAARDAHEEKCERAKARALPKDDDAAGWAALAERMKNAALLAQAKGHRDEYEANLRRSEACAEKARAASEKQKGVA
jgi:hypothetical protein